MPLRWRRRWRNGHPFSLRFYHFNRASVGNAFFFTTKRVFEINRAEKIYRRLGAVGIFYVRTRTIRILSADFYLEIINYHTRDSKFLMSEIVELLKHFL